MYYFAFIALGSALMQFLLLPIYIRLKNKQKYTPLKITIKACMTGIAVAFCAYAVFKLFKETGSLQNLVTSAGYHTNLFVLCGMCICLLADIALVICFPVGMLLFLCGHLCYIAYFLTIAPFNPVSIIIFIVLCAITATVYGRYRNEMGKLMIAFYIYGTVIIGTVSLGILLPFSIGPYGVVPAIAAVLLVISDFMLALNKIFKRKVLSDLMYLGYYFTGQFFMALSVFVPIVFNL